MVGFGLDMSAEDQAVLLSSVSVVLAMFERTQITAPVAPHGHRADAGRPRRSGRGHGAARVTGMRPNPG